MQVPASDTTNDGVAAIADPAERLAALRAIADPVARAVAFRKVIKDRNTLTRDESALYRETVAQLRGDGERKQSWIARRIGITRGGVGRLLSPKPETESA